MPSITVTGEPGKKPAHALPDCPLFSPPLVSDPAYRDLAVMRVDLDPESPAVAPRGGEERAPAAHEGIQHGVADKREEFHATQRQLDREGGGR